MMKSTILYIFRKENSESMETQRDFWVWPEGYEAVKALADFLPEEARDAYVMGCFSMIIGVC